jgi:hypothetical protein
MATAKAAYANIVRLYPGDKYYTDFKKDIRYEDAILVPSQEQMETIQKVHNARPSEIEAIHNAFVEALKGAAAELNPKVHCLNYQTRNSSALVRHDFITPATADKNNIQGEELRKILEAALKKFNRQKIAQHDMSGKPITQETSK